MFKKVKELLGVKKSTNLLTLLDGGGNVVMTIKDKLRTWESYVKDLFSDTRGQPSLDILKGDGPEITLDEIKNAIKSAKKGKAVGPDEIPSEVLKLLMEDNMPVIAILFNGIYNSGLIPEDWLQSTFVTLL